MNTTGYMAVLDKYILWLLNTLESLFGSPSYMYIYGCCWIVKLLLIIDICRKIKQIVSVDFGYIPMKLPFAVFWRFVWRMMRQRWLFITVDYHHVGCSGTPPSPTTNSALWPFVRFLASVQLYLTLCPTSCLECWWCAERLLRMLLFLLRSLWRSLCLSF